MPVSKSSVPMKMRGFTLIELVVGLTVFALGLTALFSILSPELIRRSTAQIDQVRVAELGQAILQEISARAFDDAVPLSGAQRCGDDAGSPACTAESQFGGIVTDPSTTPVSIVTNRIHLDDVDDFDTQGAWIPVESFLSEDLTDGEGRRYANFAANIDVSYPNGTPTHEKRIIVQVRTPVGEIFPFAAVRWNY